MACGACARKGPVNPLRDVARGSLSSCASCARVVRRARCVTSDRNARNGTYVYRRVREMIPQDRLLEYNVKQGWAPLCQFLEVESCPTTAFPKTNSARSLQIQTISAMAIPLTITLFVLFYVFSCVFQRMTNQSVLGWLGMKRLQILEYLTGREMMVQKRRTERAAAMKKKGGEAKLTIICTCTCIGAYM